MGFRAQGERGVTWSCILILFLLFFCVMLIFDAVNYEAFSFLLWFIYLIYFFLPLLAFALCFLSYLYVDIFYLRAYN